MATGTGRVVFLWSVRACWVPDGAGQLNVPSAQSLLQNNDFGANGGQIVVPGGNNPSAANITTACNTLATNVGNALGGTGAPASGTANLGIIQGWGSGTG